MLQVASHGIQVDGCEPCGGLWLDHGELGALARLPSIAITEITLRISQTGGGARPLRSGAVYCPSCHRPMQEHPFAAPSGVQVDTCDGCRGLWLDAGELETIRAFLARQAAGMG
jgi:Zn-finger nucleic acid-binding protein